MKPSLLIAASFLAIFSSGTEAINCYSCQWDSLGTAASMPSCKDEPSGEYLEEFYDFVELPFAISKSQGAATPEFLSKLAAEMEKRANTSLAGNAPESTANPAPNVIYELLCVTWEFSLNVNGESANAVVRYAYPVSQASTYVNTCQTNDPPNFIFFLNTLVPNSDISLLPYRTSNNFCYCGTDGCNSGAKPTASAFAAILSLFLAKFFL